MAAGSAGGANSGWQALGVWQVPGSVSAGTITAVSASPARGSGSAQTFVFTLTDSKGASDIGVANVLINDFIDGRHACYLAYVGTAEGTGNKRASAGR